MGCLRCHGKQPIKEKVEIKMFGLMHVRIISIVNMNN
tara:strand:+ start:65 stop:175 length:111 start_codon:yes stop_codon:yes gene_type:complete